MDINEAIIHILNGDAILFAGAGFSYGAQNINGEKFLLGNELSEKMIKDADLDEDDLNLEYISELYIEEKGIESFIALMKREYICKAYSNSHKIISNLNWKRIYTTNYDNIIEKSSLDSGKYRPFITANDKIRCYNNKNDVVIHLNGYIERLNEDTVFNEFKLTNESYMNKEVINQWSFLLEEDLNNSKCIIFVGYSLEYDKSIQELIAATEKLREKCFFITFNPTKRSLRLMEKYGQVLEIGVDGFAKKIEEIKKDYKTLKIEPKLMCFEKFNPRKYKNLEFLDKDITELLFYGKINYNHLVNNSKSKYIIKRDITDSIVNQLLSDIELEIITSDLGNGKTIFLEYLKKELANYGDVYTLTEINNYFIDDLDMISKSTNKKFIFVENYNLYLNSKYFKYFNLHKSKTMKFIFSARSYINDNFYVKLVDKLKINENYIAINNINKLSENEISKIIELIDEYNLWGEKATEKYNKKKEFIQEECNCQIRDVLLYLFRSEIISKKIDRIIEDLRTKKEMRELIIIAFVNRIVDLNLNLENMLLILGIPRLSASITQHKNMNELFSFGSNEITIKSSIVGYYILQNNKFDLEVVDTLVKMMISINKQTYIFKYREIMKLLLAFSNLRIILNSKAENFSKNVISFYERIKNLEFNKENPFFWLQYAIARMDIKDYKEAKLYLESAYAYAKSKKTQEVYQLDSHKARFLLESTIYYNNYNEAYKNFMEAHSLIYYNSNKPANLHYPLKQAIFYHEFYIKFYELFDETQKGMFLFSCNQIKDKFNEHSNALEKEGRSKNRDIQKIEDKIDFIISDITKNINQDTILV
ncbi:SIR2 family protein [Clostridium perfringens]|nr:SIR2 family protein [Clostridium perfringens]